MKGKNEATTQQKAYKYFVLGLTVKETAKLLDLSPRTIERYVQAGGWSKDKVLKSLSEQIQDLQKAGKSYSKIAQMVGVSKTTVYNHLKRLRA